ncbi:MAG: TonB-dependent receptor domain-containing protein, partial [Bryobacteraceae bacterium]
MPLPNDFRGGDGLNTARHTWVRSGSDDFNQLTAKVDHNLNDAHRLTFSYTFGDASSRNAFLAQPFPKSPGGDVASRDHLYSLAVTSTLRSNLVNEFRGGALRPRVRFLAPWEIAGTEALLSAGNNPYLLDFLIVNDPVSQGNDPQGRITPSSQYGDTITWLKGKHTFKGGAEVRWVSSNGYNSFDVMPRVVLGAGSTPVQAISTIPGIGLNTGQAQQMLTELAGSVNNVRQAFNSPGGRDPQFLPGEFKQRTWRQTEMYFFFKDDYKVTPNLTLNLGVRYEYLAVPYEANGKAVTAIGGSPNVFGLSGTSFGDMFQPGRLAGSLTRTQQVGKNSPNPGQKLFANDLNNFAPAVGLSWSLPWLGARKTVLRMGYSMGYERNA